MGSWASTRWCLRGARPHDLHAPTSRWRGSGASRWTASNRGEGDVVSHVQGDTSERTRESGGTPRPRMENHWAAYWDRLEEHVIFRVEASDYVTRLEAALGLDPRARVLDFGCGFGFIA